MLSFPCLPPLLIIVSIASSGAIEARGDQPVRELVDGLGGWPVIDPDWDDEQFDLINVLAKLRLLNNRILVNIWVSSDDKNSEVNIIQASIERQYSAIRSVLEPLIRMQIHPRWLQDSAGLSFCCRNTKDFLRGRRGYIGYRYRFASHSYSIPGQ